jgi:hypothetical protein
MSFKNWKGLCEKKFTIPNLLYYCNNIYYCRPTWKWVVKGGYPRKCGGRQKEQLPVHAGTELGMSEMQGCSRARCKVVQARATYGARTGQKCGCGWKGVDMRAQMSDGYADGKVITPSIRSSRDIGKTNAKSFVQVQQIYTTECISKNMIYYGGK